ncbi:MAG: enoyl-CoA hydratase/isomerase family protein [Pseudomonadota bacterium]|nr:enoyl-CoA hydratase/isomerase family protein [Pseudomonadota bacterium]
MAIDLKLNKGVGVITLNGPPANAYDLEMLYDLQRVLKEVRSNGDIKCAVIKSGLEKFFSAGANISTIKDSDLAEFDNFLMVAGETMAMLEATPKIIIAAVAGHAMGGGLELALACDIRVGSEGAYKIGLVETKLGLNPAMGGTQRLPRIIGRSRAIHMIATAETISPERAHELGVLDFLYPENSFDTSVTDYAEKLALGPSLAQGVAKLSVNKGMESGLTEAIAIERANQNILFKTEDAKEGVSAFVEKRNPKFSGK